MKKHGTCQHIKIRKFGLNNSTLQMPITTKYKIMYSKFTVEKAGLATAKSTFKDNTQPVRKLTEQWHSS